ncbi:MAG: citrate synthase [Anaerovoracaceae bacterium]|nr:citrate synthase [Bacillota bacterium]MDY2670840.1 citrate synthase [Anaerovoracaceae bacterium]
MLSTTSYKGGFGNVTHEEALRFKAREDKFIEDNSLQLKENMDIEKELYDKYNVKRGLRNKNGTGVCVGLTRIADVHGYDIDENGKKVPVPGKLYYRGISVEDIIKGCWADDRFGYEEASFLLLFGRLPNRDELKEYKAILGARRQLPQGFIIDHILTSPSKSIMNQLAREVLALYSYDQHPDDINIENVFRQSILLLGYFPTLVAYSYQAKRSHFDKQSMHLHYPEPELSTAENILRMIRPTGEYTDIEAKVLDTCLILHAEHGGGNNSTFTIHTVSSTNTDTYSAIAAGIGSLKGPRHGGASRSVIYMMNDLKENVSDIRDFDQIDRYLRRVARGEANDGSGLIYGVGHAIYTITDPRAQLLKGMAKKIAKEKGLMDEFRVYDYIENNASRILSEYLGTEIQVPANIDLYSGFVYRALGIPMDLVTPMFATARVAGWCAHRIEEVSGDNKIIRPAYQWIADYHDYKPIKDR